MTTQLTPTDKQDKLTDIARNFTDEVIRLSSRKQLDDLCRGIFPYSKLKKAEAAEKLIETLQGTRKKLEDEAEELKAELNEREKALEAAEYVQTVSSQDPEYIQRRIMMRKEYGMQPVEAEESARVLYQAVRDIAISEANLEQLRERLLLLANNHFLRETNTYRPSTAKSRQTIIRKLFKRQVEGEDNRTKRAVEDALNLFVRYYGKCLYRTIQQVNQTTKAGVYEREHNAVIVDIDPLLAWSEDVLKKREDWRDVSIALILATGRRMSEVHATAEFRIISPDRVAFKGQLKTKGTQEPDYEFEIPTLLDASLCVAGLEYLASQGRRYEATPELDISDIVNAKVSKQLSRRMIDLQILLGYGPKLIYKDMRALYAEECYRLWGYSQLKQKPAYFQEILGHSSGSTDTAKSYTKFRLVTDSSPTLDHRTETGLEPDRNRTETGQFERG